MVQFGPLTALELCAGAGGQALGLERAGFECKALVELDKEACETLVRNRRNWDVRRADVNGFDASEFAGVDLVAAGVPCPPFSIAGKQLGERDERDLFPAALDIVRTVSPRAVMLENVRGFASPKFDAYRRKLDASLLNMGYVSDCRVLNASDFGVPQLRPRFVLIAIRQEFAGDFLWPAPRRKSRTVGKVLLAMMSSQGWRGASRWAKGAGRIAPTIVGGSKKHGGPDLGPTRAKREWRVLGVDGHGVADSPPARDFPVEGLPRLTVEMVARLQGFPSSWRFFGGKTARYRQVGNAFPPPVAEAVGVQLKQALLGQRASKVHPAQVPAFAVDRLAPSA
jgi:DNA (cytosine-5)-methyltransferase 1